MLTRCLILLELGFVKVVVLLLLLLVHHELLNLRLLLLLEKLVSLLGIIGRRCFELLHKMLRILLAQFLLWLLLLADSFERK
jgi:hypothetical protein